MFFFACAVCSFYHWGEKPQLHMAGNTFETWSSVRVHYRQPCQWNQRESHSWSSLSLLTADQVSLGHCLYMATCKHWAKKQRVCFNHLRCGFYAYAYIYRNTINTHIVKKKVIRTHIKSAAECISINCQTNVCYF